MSKLFTIILIAIVGFQQIESACKVCNKHEFACVDVDKFQICIDGKIDETVTLQCKPGEICTDLSMACVPKGNTTAVPGCSSDCGICPVGKTFTCVGKNAYGLCRDGELTTVIGICPGDKVCDTAGPSVCARPCDVKSLICEKDFNTTTTPISIITTTTPLSVSPTSTSSSSPSTPLSPPPTSPVPTTPTATPTPTPIPSLTPSPTPAPNKLPQTVCNEKQNPGRYPLNNGNCNQEYVYCRMQESNLVGIASKCPSGRVFNGTTQSCEISPAGCNV